MVHDYKLLKTDKYRKEKKQLLPNARDIIWDSKLNLNLEINRKYLHFEKFQNKEMLWHRIKKHNNSGQFVQLVKGFCFQT